MKLFPFWMVAGLLWFLIPTPAQCGEATVAVASNFLAPLKALTTDFHKESGDSIRVVSGSTGKLFAQVVHGAPFDAFLAADGVRPRKLAEQGFALPKSQFTYALGKLVLWSSDPQRISGNGAHFLKQGHFKHLALANPKTAPYGYAALALLRALKLDGLLKPRLVYGENIGQAFQFAATGNAQAGLVALSQIRDPQLKIKGSHWIVPDRLYPAIAQDAILLKHGESNAVAREFLEFIQSKPAGEILRRFGYGLIRKP